MSGCSPPSHRRVILATTIALSIRLLGAGCATHETASPRWAQLPGLPEPLGVAAPFAGVSRGALIVAGGANFPNGFPWQGGKKIWHDDAFVLSDPDGHWQQAGRLPRPLAYGISITTANGMICIGGSDTERHYAEVFRAVWRNGVLQSEPLSPLPIPIANAAGALVNGTVFVFGGSEQPGEQSALNRLFSLKTSEANAAWRELESLPGQARILPIAASFEGAFHVFGGVALESINGKVTRVYLRDAWRYREREGWRRLADAPRPVAASPSPAPVMGGEILLLAGDDGSRAGFQPVELHPGFPAQGLTYDPHRDAWREFVPVPAPRATVPCVEWRGCFVMPSGEVRPGVRSPKVWSLQPQPANLATP